MGAISFRAVTPVEADTPTLRAATRRHAGETYAKLRLQGKDVEWKRLGVDPTEVLRQLPFGPKK